MKNKIKDLLYKLAYSEYCADDCYGCCGDGKLDITCDIVVEKFEKELLKYYQPKFAEIEKDVIKKLLTSLKEVVESARISNRNVINSYLSKMEEPCEQDMYLIYHCKGKIHALDGIETELDYYAKQYGVDWEDKI